MRALCHHAVCCSALTSLQPVRSKLSSRRSLAKGSTTDTLRSRAENVEHKSEQRPCPEQRSCLQQTLAY